MASATSSPIRYFVVPRGSASAPNGRAASPNGSTADSAMGGDGSSAHPAANVAAALHTIAEQHGGIAPTGRRLRASDQVEICAVANSTTAASLNTTAALARTPRYEFYVDPLSIVDAAGNGSLKAPWRDLDSALAGIAQLDAEGAIPLRAGEHLRLSVREVFAATAVDRKKRRVERVIQVVLLLMTLMLVIPLIAILTHLVAKAWPVLSPTFLFDNPHNNMTAGGIWGPLVGTFYLVFISLAVAAPIGVLAGVYLNEYARDNWFTRIVNLAVVNLAGVPSIVHALFGVGAFVMFAGMGESVLAASCTLAIMTLPVIISSTKEALASVPMTFREACWNMGASRWQTIRTIVLPNAISGILTGVILQVSRAAGETAPILFTGAAYFMSVPNKGLRYFFPYSLDDSCMALSYHLHVMLTQVKGASAEEIAAGRAVPLEHLQYGTAVVLIGLVLLVNSASIGLRMYLRSRKKW